MGRPQSVSFHCVSTHSRTEAAAEGRSLKGVIGGVSTHSRTEAAASGANGKPGNGGGFNTQPHGGGCIKRVKISF